MRGLYDCESISVDYITYKNTPKFDYLFLIHPVDKCRNTDIKYSIQASI